MFRIFKKWVYIAVFEALRFAGGDAVTGAATVILAVGAGKATAEAIDKDILGE